MTETPVPEPTGHTPWPLLLGACVVAGQGLFLVSYAIVNLVLTAFVRPSSGLPVSVFFALLGGCLIAAGWGLVNRHSWARGPGVMAQLIQLGLAITMIGNPGRVLVLALLLALIAVGGLVGVFHPRSIAALESDRDAADTP